MHLRVVLSYGLNVISLVVRDDWVTLEIEPWLTY